MLACSEAALLGDRTMNPVQKERGRQTLSLLCLCLLLAVSTNAVAVDDRGNTATQGRATWLRAAQSMIPKPQYVHRSAACKCPPAIAP